MKNYLNFKNILLFMYNIRSILTMVFLFLILLIPINANEIIIGENYEGSIEIEKSFFSTTLLPSEEELTIFLSPTFKLINTNITPIEDKIIIEEKLWGLLKIYKGRTIIFEPNKEIKINYKKADAQDWINSYFNKDI